MLKDADTHFMVQGFDRSYWSFFSGFGFFSTAFLLFSVVFAVLVTLCLLLAARQRGTGS